MVCATLSRTGRVISVRLTCLCRTFETAGMDESNESGFKWILARLSDGLRQKYCSQALQEELDDVQTQLAKCSEGMAHAVQVEDAIASLQANQISNAPVRARTYSVARLLAELQALQHSLESKMATLLQPLTVCALCWLLEAGVGLSS